MGQESHQQPYILGRVPGRRILGQREAEGEGAVAIRVRVRRPRREVDARRGIRVRALGHSRVLARAVAGDFWISGQLQLHGGDFFFTFNSQNMATTVAATAEPRERYIVGGCVVGTGKGAGGRVGTNVVRGEWDDLLALTRGGVVICR